MADFGRNCAFRCREIESLWNSPKFISKTFNLVLSAFFYFVRTIPAFRGIFARKTLELPNFFGYSIVKYLQKRKERRLFQDSFENSSRHRS